MARKILLADDSVTAQNMGRKILADAGYEVITVNNGSAALKKVTEQKPDLIVLDVYMPGYSGLEVCQRLKEAGDTSRIPILLTVGKLEPFKPEEARRVRADAYIVKPFEASELLSALSKLEDKVVPRSEHSKPGRFARATAAIDERFDRSMAVEEDSSWKNRIAFPKKKEKEKEPEPEADDPAVYNPINRDLRTVVDHKPEEHRQVAPPQAEEHKVNLSALAPEGMPKDVTPEEIAALAAAAAQVKGKFAVENATEEKSSESPAEASAVTATQPAEIESEVKEAVSATEPLAPVAPNRSVPEQEESEAEPKEADIEKEAAIAPSASEVTAAISGLEQKSAEESKESGNASWVEAAKSEEPVTMAAATAAGANGPRWTAVAVALSPEETSISLEQEMQKAASFAIAAEPERVEIPSANSETGPVTVAMVEVPAPAEVAETSRVEASAAVLPVVEAPVVQDTPPFADAPSSLNNMGSDSEGMSAAIVSESTSTKSRAVPEVAGFEAVSSTSAEVEPVAASTTESDSAAQVNEAAVPGAAKQEIEPVESVTANVVTSSIEQAPAEESPRVLPEGEMQVPAPEIAASTESGGTEESAPKEEIAELSASHSASHTEGGTDEGSKKESDVTATTAAAWASWRKIRETGDRKPENEETGEPKDEAAKAVAAGAENNPEEVSELDSDPEIANIVDSVLADMRPKIVQEIAKKLGKKK